MSFVSRHIGINQKNTVLILKSLGYKSLNEFVNDIIPKNINNKLKEFY